MNQGLPPGLHQPIRRLPARRRAVFGLIAVGMGLALLSLLDHLIGWSLALAGHPVEPGWIFPTGHRSTFSSNEFDHAIETSSQGLRDRDYAIPKPEGTLRVAVVGDSFTYGWGVELDRVWLKRMEERLRATLPGGAVEVVNLGKPGGDPLGYVQTCERVLPRLKPDWLIVGVTLGDDLIQLGLRTNDAAGVRTAKFPDCITEWVFPTCSALVKRRMGLNSEMVEASLRAQARRVVDRFDEAARARYAKLDPQVRRDFEAGRINPILIDHGCRVPTLYEATLDPQHPLMKKAARRLRLALSQIEALARPQGTRILVLSVPYGGHVSPEVLAGRHRLGFELSDALLTTDVPDRIVAEACRDLGLPFLEVTAAFRSDGAPGAYFPLDGHLSAAGHDRLAELITPAVRGTITTGTAFEAMPRLTSPGSSHRLE